MKYKELKKEIVKISKANHRKDKERTCQYKGTSRWCNLTTQLRCTGCRWYEPNAETVYNDAIEAIKAAQEKQLDAEIRFYGLKNTVIEQTEKLSDLSEQLYFGGLRVAPNQIVDAVNKLTDKAFGGDE